MRQVPEVHGGAGRRDGFPRAQSALHQDLLHLQHSPQVFPVRAGVHSLQELQGLARLERPPS
jgi:hypothetical protein